MTIIRTSILRPVGVAGILAVLAFLFVARVEEGMVDFRVNRTAAHRMLHGENLYRIEDGHYQFKYPPFAAVIYIPAAVLSPRAAAASWYALLLTAAAFFFAVSRRLAGLEKSRAALATALSGLILGRYFFREIELGQINILVNLLLACSAAALASARKTAGHRISLSGCLWGASVSLKVYSIAFLPYFVVRRKWAVMIWGFLAIASAAVLPILFFGPAGNIQVHRDWIVSLAGSTPGLFTTQDNISLAAFFSKWRGFSLPASLLTGISLAALGIGMLRVIARGDRSPGAVRLEASLLMMLIPLVSPLGWDYTFLAALPAVMFLIKHFSSFSHPARAGLGILLASIPLSLYDLMGPALYSRYMAASVPTLVFLGLAGFLAAVRFRGWA